MLETLHQERLSIERRIFAGTATLADFNRLCAVLVEIRRVSCSLFGIVEN